jgi:aryl-alcohol dehydrogenase-like predicted oxidoreductase
VLKRARQSVLTLGRKPVDLLLVHSAGDLAGEDGRALWRGLLGLRDEGLYKGIGISAYVADDPAQLARDFRPDAMQVPFSLLDQRLLRNGALAAMKDQGVEIHARSLFLQGLMFMEDVRLPPKLRHAAPHLAAVRRYVADAGSTPLAAALAFALSTPQIDVALVGVSSPSELDEIIGAAAARPIPDVDWAACALDDETVLTPSLW